ncbi:1-deoxy-D-xylulose-5-phosphate reductoisomerase [Wohlfahrtiimonas populi]|uniref:1-deoxy-D-xylulose-5-phosphate reductoisomerase n=1 Tax=Wohlfahrtiimonas populi TaxID=1940240 RepID=UPI00098D5EAF|nr:1-deoxy-D-xylulose-5-phosphate reductoisomerase [Wohlfahrtiimonas populi]
MKQVSILGATGSIGSSTLTVIRNNPAQYQVHSVVADRSVQKMLEICKEFHPKFVVMANVDAASELETHLFSLGLSIEVLAGEEAIAEIVKAPEIDLVVAAIVGAKGFLSSLSAVKAGKTILLANKESLVMGGSLFMQAVKDYGATLLPIDSEHNALFQSLPKDEQGRATLDGVSKLVLTASGGPFRNTSLSDMAKIKKEDALKHPRWDMGAKVTIDSSTLMNKGLEFIEAHFLFNMPPEDIDVVIHPQSIIHSLVAYKDGSLLAQLGEPDMTIPIAHALGYPKRVLSGKKPVDMTQMMDLTFAQPDLEHFPCLRIAKECLIKGNAYLVAMNAINEILVEAFLQDKIEYLDIPKKLEEFLSQLTVSKLNSFEEIIEFDQLIRQDTIEKLKA